MPTEEDIEEIYSKAVGQWTGADWTHERKVDGSIEWDDYDQLIPVYCSGEGIDDGCEVCEDAQSDADGAESCAEEAMEAFRKGDYELASSKAQEASRIEGEWGDDPTWGDLRRALDEVLIDGLDIECE